MLIVPEPVFPYYYADTDDSTEPRNRTMLAEYCNSLTLLYESAWHYLYPSRSPMIVMMHKELKFHR